MLTGRVQTAMRVSFGAFAKTGARIVYVIPGNCATRKAKDLRERVDTLSREGARRYVAKVEVDARDI